MSPFSTFMSWGISSNLCRRKNLPVSVRRGSSPAVEEPPILSAFSTIDLNLNILNGLPWRPTRIPLYMIGPFEVVLTSMLMMRISGERMMSPEIEDITSKIRFGICLL